MTRFQRAPRPLSAGLSLAAGLLVLLLLSEGPEQSRAVLGQAVGLLLLLVGARYSRTRQRSVGLGIAGLGGSIAIAAVGRGWSTAGSAIAQVEWLAGTLGLLVLGIGVTGLRRGWERPLVSLGASALLGYLLLRGVVGEPPMTVLLVTAVATVVAWDVGEQAINIGEQMGVTAETRSAELLHAGGSAGVGAVAIVLAIGGYQVGVEEVPLSGLVLLAVGVVTLVAALDS